MLIGTFVALCSVYHTLGTNDVERGNKGLSFVKEACSGSEKAQRIKMVPRTHGERREPSSASHSLTFTCVLGHPCPPTKEINAKKYKLKKRLAERKNTFWTR